MKKPTFWPKNPYPASVFPMSEEQYPEIVPDPELRTALSGMLGRRFWNIASEAIWAAMVEDDWTEVWPVESGHYWFYGWCSRLLRRNYMPEMVLVKVRKTSKSFAYVGNGRFIYKADAVGLWKKAVLPEPPLIEVLREALLG